MKETVLKFENNLEKGILTKRHKRFLAEIQLQDGTEITAFCPNTGSMKGLAEPGNKVFVRNSNNPKRKLLYTWELVEVDQILVGINTSRSNYLVKEAVKNGVLVELQRYNLIKLEVPFGSNSRLDLLLQNETERCFVEVKNVTLVEKDVALFPDAVTSRGTKHLKHLARIVENGHRAIICFVVQRMDSNSFLPAWQIDPQFSQTLSDVFAKGVEILVYQANISIDEIKIVRKLPFLLK